MTVDGVSWTFGDLVGIAEDLQRGLIQAGLAEGAVIGTDLPSGPELFALVLAALRGGYGVFPISSAEHPERREELLGRAGVVLDVVAVPAAGSTIPQTAPDRLRVPGPRPPVADHAGHLVYTTSGTTGEPAVVRHERRWYAYRGVAVRPQYAAGVDRGPHIMANSAFHLGTLGPALYALQAGSAVVVMPTWSAGEFRRLVDEHAADSAFLTADLIADLVAGEQVPRHRLACVLHGGSAIAPSLKRRAIDMFGPVFHEFYGTSHGVITEVGTADWLRRPGTVGTPLPGVTLAIVRDGVRVPPGEIGRVHVRYRAVDGAASFQDTGDVGFVDADGFLFVLGRATNGESVDLVRLEHLIHGLDGVSDAVVLRTPGGVRCYVETLARPEQVIAEINGLVDRIGVERLTVVPARNGTFPRTRSGKLHRRELAAR